MRSSTSTGSSGPLASSCSQVSATPERYRQPPVASGAMRCPVTRQQTRTYNADHIETGGHSSYTKPPLADYFITIKQQPTNGFVSSYSL